MIGDNYYIRMDRGDEIISNLFEICEKESIPSDFFGAGIFLLKFMIPYSLLLRAKIQISV